MRYARVTGALGDPPEILLTTPESLEAILMSSRRNHRELFGSLRTVVVDEVHAFGGDDRGWHLLAVLERLAVVAGRDLQRIGLSATVGDPTALLSWLVGSSAAPTRVVAPVVAQASAPEITLDHVGSLGNAATVIAALHAGEKRLVFCDSRARVEELTVSLRDRGVTTFVSHSSLALDERRRAEEAFAEASDCVIVATSTLELGIDVGDLDRVIQIDSPTTVAGFLQRLGRSGRRPGTTRNMLVLTTRPEIQLVQAAGLLHLWSTGFVEPVIPPPQPYHLLAQQVLAYALQEGSITRTGLSSAVGRLPLFASAVTSGLAGRIVDHLVESEMLFDCGHGVLSIGPDGERSYGYRHFIDLTSAFTANPLFVIRHGSREVGYLDPIALLTQDRHFATVLLAGRVWQITSIDWTRRFAWVEPADGEGRSRWLGTGQALSPELCDSMRSVLAGADPSGVTLTARATGTLDEIRDAFRWVRPGRTAVVDDGSTLRWWTFAGLHANAGLMATLGPLAGGTRPDNLMIALDRDRASVNTVRAAIRDVDATALPAPAIADELATRLKFSDCLSSDVALATSTARVNDQAAIDRVRREPVDLIDAVAGDSSAR